MSSSPDCVLWLAGARFADSAAALAAGTPTALADVSVRWGRGTTVDQPGAATATVTVVDRTGGATFLDRVDVGTPLELWATGDITAGPVDVVVDGSFETAPAGPAGRRIGSPGYEAADVAVGAAYDGTHALDVWHHVNGRAAAARLWVPPAPYDPAAPNAWDQIPRLAVGDVWVWAVAVRAGWGETVTVYPVALAGPQSPTGATRIGAGVAAPSGFVWTRLTGTVTVPAGTVGWLGVEADTIPVPWQSAPGTWQAAPSTWAQAGARHVDAVAVALEGEHAYRTVLVFSGVVTDLRAGAALDGVRIELTAIDQLADLENRYVGAEPWPAETVTDRVANILAATATTVTARIDPGRAGLVVGRRDVDHQAAGSLLGELAAGVDGVLWSATHADTGPYLWLEDMAARAQLGELTLIGDLVEIVLDPGRAGSTTIDGCDVPADAVTWLRDVSDVITVVDAGWSEQVTAPDLPVDHVEHVTDTAGVAAHGVRRAGVTTQLTTAADAEAVAERILARTAAVAWRVEGLTWDTGLAPPVSGLRVSDVLDLLDGTGRLGRGLIVTDVAVWPGGDTVALYLEGGRYRYDGAWVLELDGSPNVGIGVSVTWVELDPVWRWDQFDPAIGWSDLYGVAA